MSKPYEVKDRYYHKAKKDGYVARSVYKLKDIDEKFKVLKKNGDYLDIGCAPGSWIQFIDQYTSDDSTITGIDILDLKYKSSKVYFTKADIYDDDALVQVIQDKRFDIVLSDIAPNTTGIRVTDLHASIEMCSRVWHIAKIYLKPHGNMIMKVFYDNQANVLLNELKEHFKLVKNYKPPSVRSRSFETYVVCIDKR